MAKKKAKRVVRRGVSGVARKIISNQRGRSASSTRASSKKLRKVIINLILFVLLGIISYGLYSVSTQEIYVNLFYLLSFLFGFVSLAFFIALLVLLILRGMGR